MSGDWLTESDIRLHFPHLAHGLDHWSRHGCPFLPERRKLRPARRSCATSGRPLRHWPRADLRAADAEYQRLAARGADGDRITVEEAVRELRVSRWLLYELAKGGLDLEHERRLVRRGEGEPYPSDVAVLSKKKLRRLLRDARPEVAIDPDWLTPGEAAKVTRDAFPCATITEWAEADCPYLGRPLDTCLRDKMQALKVRHHGVAKQVRRVRRNQLHVSRKDILDAYAVYRRNRAAARKAAGGAAPRGAARRAAALAQGIDLDAEGKRWLTQAAAFRLHGCRQQALEHWSERRWVRKELRKRKGYGRYPEVPWYCEEDILRCRARQGGGDRHVRGTPGATPSAVPASAAGPDTTPPRGAHKATPHMPGAANDTAGRAEDAGARRGAGSPACPYMDLMKEIHAGVRANGDKLDQAPRKTADEVCGRMRDRRRVVTPKGTPGRPQSNGHFLDYFERERKRLTRAEKTDREIYLAYRTAYPEQEICKNKRTLKHYLDACRTAVSDAREKASKEARKKSVR